MSEGPYKTVPFHGADSDGYSEVVDSNGRVAYTTDEESARQVCKELNLAHAHATAASAKRLAEACAGTYKIGPERKTCDPPLYNVVGPRSFYSHFMSHTEACILVRQLNKPIEDLAAAARRVRELEEALAAHRAVWDAVNRYDYCMCREPEKQNAAYYELRALHKKVLDVDVWGMEALAGKERTDGAE